MKKNVFFMGMLAMVLAFGLVMVGCGDPDPDKEQSPTHFELSVANAAEYMAAIEQIKNGGNDKTYDISLAGDVSAVGISSNPTFGYVTDLTVTLNGGGKKISLSCTGSIFRLGSTQSLVVNNATLDGSGVAENTTSLVYLDSGSSFIMTDTIISGNVNTGETIGFVTSGGSGGGVNVHGSGAIFTMNSGEISSNTAESSGGGVFVGSGATFTMNDGEISDNGVKLSGGGVSVSGTFIMNGGTLSGNTSTGGIGLTEASGGGVNVEGSGATFTMNDGEISDNTSTIFGGGVHVSGGATFNMYNGVINGNHIGDGSYRGGGGASVGGFYPNDTATFNMHGGTIIGAGEGANTVTGSMIGTSLCRTSYDVAKYGDGTAISVTAGSVTGYFYTNVTLIGIPAAQ